MTGFMHEKEFSRKSFVKGSGALVVGFSLAGALTAGKASAAAAPSPAGYLPDLSQTDSWFTFGADNTVTLTQSKIEVGNGITTGFLEVAAEELDADMSQMRYGQSKYDASGHALNTVVDSWVAANTGGEGGSNAMSGTGQAIRLAAATARQAILNVAASQFGVAAGSLTISKGTVSGGGKSATFGQLVGGKLLATKIAGATATAAALANPGQGITKPIANYSMVNKRDVVSRIDIPAKVNGGYIYVHLIRVPGMLHGRIVRPRGQGAYLYNSNVPVSVDETSIAHIPNAKVVQINNFLGVVAPKEYDAIQAAAQLKVVWNTNPILPGDGNIWSHYRQLDSSGQIAAKVSANIGNVDAALATSAHTVSFTAKHHYQAHVPIGPSCAVADVRSDRATVWSNTQNIPNLVNDLINVLSPIPAQNIRCLFYEGSASYGNGMVAFDTAESACIMSKAVGAPVRLQFMRWDEQGWTHYAPAIMYDMRAGIDANGMMTAYDATGFGQGGTSLYTARELLGTTGPGATAANALPTTIAGGGAVAENLSPWMQVSTKNYRITSKGIIPTQGIFHSGALRGPGAQQTTLADAQTMDLLATAAGMDPLAFRLKNMNTDLDGQRWAAVLQAAATAANWQPKVMGSQIAKGNIKTGRGMANSHHGGAYAAVVADVSVNVKTGKLSVTHLYAAEDHGLTVNPNLIDNQMLGNLIQGTSRALLEEVQFNTNHVTSTDWVTYPILRFKDAPQVTTVIVDRTDQPCLGAGEPPTCPVIGAIANAFFDATGVRMTEAPFTSGRVRATLKAAGVA